MNLRLRELRESQNISVATMIERLGVKDSRYRKWESQAAAMPLEYAVRCCSILHCTMDELTGREQIALSDDERELLEILRSLEEPFVCFGQPHELPCTASTCTNTAGAAPNRSESQPFGTR